MIFTEHQEKALKAVRDWLEDPSSKQVFRLFGYAGTGKTTMAKELDADFFAAYTGKAAHVLRQKGCPAQTVHSLIYHPHEKSKERLRQMSDRLRAMEPNDPDYEALERDIRLEEENVKHPGFQLNMDSEIKNARLLVIDECSMVDERMGEDLLSFGCRILVLGDPAQLPPVKGGGFFTHSAWPNIDGRHTEDPDVLLTEIHRQARDNPILDLATRIRTGGTRPDGHPCLLGRAPTQEDILGVDQLIVGKNATRRYANQRIREWLGRTDPLPEPGDKVVCLRNNHELGLLNGALYTVTNCEFKDEQFTVLELDGEQEVTAHSREFLGEKIDLWDLREAELFDYGYALTCHKSQGSQWEKVGVLDESRVFRGNARRWLYTAVTRASEELWVG